MILTTKKVSRADFEAGTGWKLAPEGACKGDVCIPLPGSPASSESVDAVELAEAMRLPVVHDGEHGVWAIGPDSLGGRALSSADAPDFELPGLDGELFRLSSLRGQKIVVYAWAPY